MVGYKPLLRCVALVMIRVLYVGTGLQRIPWITVDFNVGYEAGLHGADKGGLWIARILTVVGG